MNPRFFFMQRGKRMQNADASGWFRKQMKAHVFQQRKQLKSFASDKQCSIKALKRRGFEVKRH